MGKLIVVAIGLAAAVMVIVIAYLLRTRCPACRKPTLELDLSENPGGDEVATGGKMYRCTTCGAEYRRRHNEGPFISRAAWDAGAREAIPKVRALRRRQR